jgi:hypothetical protein
MADEWIAVGVFVVAALAMVALISPWGGPRRG